MIGYRAELPLAGNELHAKALRWQRSTVDIKTRPARIIYEYGLVPYAWCIPEFKVQATDSETQIRCRQGRQMARLLAFLSGFEAPEISRFVHQVTRGSRIDPLNNEHFFIVL
ncbi:hypothetical protein KNO81_39365 [Paraburkholderia sediminicola]|nr:hypothetical protein [Paraburkholderia sediminicola]